MNRIVRHLQAGKTTWDATELAKDPSLLHAIHAAYAAGLILAPVVGPLSKGRYTRGVPLSVHVPGLAPTP